jgi:hypothetical protein
MRPIAIRGLCRKLAAAVLSVALGGCAGMFADEGFSEVSATAQKNLNQAPVWIRSDEEAAVARAR